MSPHLSLCTPTLAELSHDLINERPYPAIHAFAECDFWRILRSDLRILFKAGDPHHVYLQKPSYLSNEPENRLVVIRLVVILVTGGIDNGREERAAAFW